MHFIDLVVETKILFCFLHAASARCAVDTSQAGMGTLEAAVTCGGASVPVRQAPAGQDKCRFTFVAKSPVDHIIELTFNGDPVPGTSSCVRQSCRPTR